MGRGGGKGRGKWKGGAGKAAVKVVEVVSALEKVGLARKELRPRTSLLYYRRTNLREGEG